MTELIIKIYGSIDRVTYHNAENGFCVLRVSVKNKRDPITVVGNATQVMAGEDVFNGDIGYIDKYKS